ncbi:MAG: hypothetical protein Q4D41_11815 [Prevotellaceae bacterium]|nr:hypothetical protein [Prevotellaceae bacterium]
MKSKFKYQSDVWSLLRQNMSKGQLIGYSIANIVGLSVILIGIMFFSDSRHSETEEDKYFSKDYIVLSKKVDGIGFSPISFSNEDIEKLKKEKWVNKIGYFTTSHFAVNGSVSIGGKGMSSYLFFESVPDDFFDIKPKDWDFNPEKKFVPIILSKDYLALYNFGFAIPQGLPQISEEIISSIPITLRLTGQDMIPEYFDAAIVGFSSRLNTIAVPQSFMDWANDRYYDGEKQNPSRLIVEINKLETSNMNRFLKEENIEIAGDKAESNKISDFLSIVSAVVTTNGIVISLLALFILLLSIFLLLQKSKEKLRNLMLLGYSPKEVGQYYEMTVAVANVVITLISLVITISCRTLWSNHLDDLNLGGASVLPVVITAILYLVVVTVFNIIVIRKHLMKIWMNN